jgi:predicted dehydrogenase
MILLMGFGYWGKNLARNFSSELTAVCDQDITRLNSAKKLYPNIEIYTDIDQALTNKSIKAVLIATKAKDHFWMAEKCITAGLDVWIPVCQNLTEILRLSDLRKKTKKIIFIDHTFCYHPAVEKLKTIDIGKPLYYNSTRISLGLFQPDVDVILDLAIHDVSIINFLYPNLELEDRQITKFNHINEISNQALINLKFTNGFTANINVNWVSPVKKREIIIAGDKSSVIYDDLEADKIKIYNTGIIDKDFNANKLGDMIAPKIDTAEALQNAKNHFLNCIQSRTVPLTGIETAGKIMRWIS